MISIAVIGLGFVGLTTALGLAEFGSKVYGIETDEERLRCISKGNIPFEEPGLSEKLADHLGKDFIPMKSVGAVIAECDAIFFCVGTPYGENGQVDLKALFQSIDDVLEIDSNKHRLFVIKSSVPPSTTEEKIIPYIESKGYRVPEDISVAVNPEFLREGHCCEDFFYADRIVIGTEDPASERLLEEIYSHAECQICSVSVKTAEFIKYLSNSSLACLISFANEMSIIADRLGGIDIKAAFDAVHMDKRWQTGSIRSYLYPGCGYGGYCLPKDTGALLSVANNKGIDCGILENVIRTNDRMAAISADKVIRALNEKNGNDAKEGSAGTIGILGLSFKPGSDDVRQSPAAGIMKELIHRGYRHICAFDPAATANFKNTYSDIACEYAGSLEETVKRSDLLVIVTAWPVFDQLKDSDKKIVNLRYTF